jgi:hypothetical protein
MPQRQALDALVAGGLAANRAEALAWCVKLFEQNQEAWLAQLREALDSVQAAAATAPPVGQA